MAGGGIRRRHGGMNQLSADPCFSKRAHVGVDESLESSWSDKSTGSCATQPSAASGGSPTSARTHHVLQLTSARSPLQVHTWQTWGAEAQAFNELSFLRGFVIAGTFVMPCASSCYLPCSPGAGGCSQLQVEVTCLAGDPGCLVARAWLGRRTGNAQNKVQGPFLDWAL